LGAIIGAIAGGGKGAAIGAGAGAGAGALTQVVTKGGAIKVPAESVLTFQLDRPLRVTAAQ
jgi:outer membrane lipoprotein SlyB